MIKTIMVLTSSIIAFSMPLFAEGTDNTQTISVQTEKLFKQWINSFKKDAISNGITNTIFDLSLIHI